MIPTKSTERKKTIILLVTSLALLPFFTLAMQSQTYKIDADTVNSGGNLSDSASYRLGDSLGEAAIGEEQSANFKSKTAFWYMLPDAPQLGLTCETSTVYMMDYTLGTAEDYSKYTYTTSENCTITDNSSAPWSLTMQSTDMTGDKNNLSNESVFLSTDGVVESGDTITSPSTPGITEPSISQPPYPSDYTLNAPKTVITGDATANGAYENQPTVKLTNLNSLFAETISGTVTITLQ